MMDPEDEGTDQSEALMQNSNEDIESRPIIIPRIMIQLKQKWVIN